MCHNYQQIQYASAPMVQIPTPTLTLEAFLTLPDTKPASEYIDGQIIQKPMPQGEHSTLQTELASSINVRLKPQKIAKAYTELRCTFGDGSVANVFSLPPDWTIEILSPDQSQTKVTKNILHCLAHGSQMGWLIDPQDRSVIVYLPNRSPVVYDLPDMALPLPDFATGLSLAVGELFGWLME
jgi:Uma2 family endonuclease